MCRLTNSIRQCIEVPALNQAAHDVVCWAAGQVCKAFCCLADDHPAAQQACASAVQPVVSFLSHPDAAVRDQACRALACLTCDCHQNQTVAGQHGALELLLQVLWKPCDSAQQQQQVVQLLMAMLVLAVQVGHLCNQCCVHAICGCSSAFSSCVRFCGCSCAFPHMPGMQYPLYCT